MILPITAYLVTTGVYDEYRVLAVFTEHCRAQEFADHTNLTTERYSADAKAQVEESTYTDRDGAGPRWTSSMVRPSPHPVTPQQSERRHDSANSDRPRRLP